MKSKKLKIVFLSFVVLVTFLIGGVQVSRAQTNDDTSEDFRTILIGIMKNLVNQLSLWASEKNLAQVSSRVSDIWLRRIGAINNNIHEVLLKSYPTADGGTISIGKKSSTAWIVKLDKYGTIQKEKFIASAVGYDIVQKPNGEYALLAGSTNNSLGNPTLFIELDKNLDVKNKIALKPGDGFRTYIDSIYFNIYTLKTLIQTSDGGYLINDYAEYSNCSACGGSTWLIKLNAEGGIQWSKFYDEGNILSVNKMIHVIQTSDGGYLGAGFSEPNGARSWIIKIKPDGEKDWEKVYYNGNLGEKFNSIEENSDSYIVAGTIHSSYPHTGYGASLLKLTKKGDIIWEKVYGLPGTGTGIGWITHARVIQKNNGEYLVVGDTTSIPNGILLLNIDTNGNLLSNFFYQMVVDPDGIEVLDFKERSNKYFIVAPMYRFNDPNHLRDASFITKVNENGEIDGLCPLKTSLAPFLIDIPAEPTSEYSTHVINIDSLQVNINLSLFSIDSSNELLCPV